MILKRKDQIELELLMATLLSKGYSISDQQEPLIASGGSEKYLSQFEGNVVYSNKPQSINYKSLSRSQRIAVMALVRNNSST